MSDELDKAIEQEVRVMRANQIKNPNAKQRVGGGKIRTSQNGRDQFGLKLSNDARRQLAESGTKDLLEGTMEKNSKLRKNQSTDESN